MAIIAANVNKPEGILIPTPPQIMIAAPQYLGSPYAGQSLSSGIAVLTYVVDYYNADSITLSPADVSLVVLSGTVTATASILPGASDSQKIISLTNFTGNGTFRLEVAAGTATNIYGSAPAASENTTINVAVAPAPTATLIATIGSTERHYAFPRNALSLSSLSNSSIELNYLTQNTTSEDPSGTLVEISNTELVRVDGGLRNKADDLGDNGILVYSIPAGSAFAFNFENKIGTEIAAIQVVMSSTIKNQDTGFLVSLHENDTSIDPLGLPGNTVADLGETHGCKNGTNGTAENFIIKAHMPRLNKEGTGPLVLNNPVYWVKIVNTQAVAITVDVVASTLTGADVSLTDRLDGRAIVQAANGTVTEQFPAFNDHKRWPRYGDVDYVKQSAEPAIIRKDLYGTTLSLTTNAGTRRADFSYKTPADTSIRTDAKAKYVTASVFPKIQPGHLIGPGGINALIEGPEAAILGSSEVRSISLNKYEDYQGTNLIKNYNRTDSPFEDLTTPMFNVNFRRGAFSVRFNDAAFTGIAIGTRRYTHPTLGPNEFADVLIKYNSNTDAVTLLRPYISTLGDLDGIEIQSIYADATIPGQCMIVYKEYRFSTTQTPRMNTGFFNTTTGQRIAGTFSFGINSPDAVTVAKNPNYGNYYIFSLSGGIAFDLFIVNRTTGEVISSGSVNQNTLVGESHLYAGVGTVVGSRVVYFSTTGIYYVFNTSANLLNRAELTPAYVNDIFRGAIAAIPDNSAEASTTGSVFVLTGRPDYSTGGNIFTFSLNINNVVISETGATSSAQRIAQEYIWDRYILNRPARLASSEGSLTESKITSVYKYGSGSGNSGLFTSATLLPDTQTSKNTVSGGMSSYMPIGIMSVAGLTESYAVKGTKITFPSVPYDFINAFNTATGSAFRNQNGTIVTDTNIFDAVRQYDGKIVVVGSFTGFAGLSRKKIIRLNPDGTEDTAFYNNTGQALDTDVNPIKTVAVLRDGSIIIGGEFVSFGGDATNKYLVKLNYDGTINTAFKGQVNGGASLTANKINKIRVNQDDKIFVCGKQIAIAGTNSSPIKQLLANGQEDVRFTTNINGNFGANSTVETLDCTFMENRDVIVGGISLGTLGGVARQGLARFTIAGTLKPCVDVNGSVYALKTMKNGNIVVGGVFGQIGPAPVGVGATGVSNFAIVRPNAQSVRAAGPVFGVGVGGPSITEIYVTTDNKLIVSGNFQTIGGIASPSVARLSKFGDVESVFANTVSPQLGSAANGIMVLENDKGGEYTIVWRTLSPDPAYNGIVRCTSDGPISDEFHGITLITNVNT